MRGWILPALLVAALASPALAQQQGQQGQPQRARIAKGSPIAKIFFAEPPLILEDDGTYAGAIQRVGKEVSRECGAVESYGWDFKGKDREQQQQQAYAVYDSTMQALEKAGYKLAEKKVRSIPDPETLVFTAERQENRLLLMWSPVQDATLLLICDAGTGAKSPPTKTPQGKK
ncbi:MAG TPA: hypothetical protein VD978_00205 [Azospirillum sp.]|nr:hypothetical protein [Azospirillum sp.]